MTEIPLVSVVIPAFNAQTTLKETLESVSAQSHANLQIIVVDDGSTDQTAAIARDFAAGDSRCILIQKPNGGVASARNAGIKASSGAFIAFIDADDLWHPTKIAKQMAALGAAGRETALVYSPNRRIDMNGMVHGSSRNHRVEGWVINRHFYVNFIGNGSSILIRRHALEEAGGYCCALRENRAQGCEDLLLQLRVALRYQFATVPEYLVGYRNSPGNMSSDDERMLRSGLLALSMVLAECPALGELAERGLLARKIWQYLKVTVARGNFRQGWEFIAPYLKGRSGQVARAAWLEGFSKLRGLYRLGKRLPARRLQPRPEIAYRHFYAYDPADMRHADHSIPALDKDGLDDIYRALLALAPLDAAYHPQKYFGRGAESGDYLASPRLATSR